MAGDEKGASQESNEGVTDEEKDEKTGSEEEKGAEDEEAKGAGGEEDDKGAEDEGGKGDEEDDKGGEEEGDEKSEVPEKYDLKLSEDSILDASRLDEIASIAREQGLSNEAAQDLVDIEEGAVDAHILSLEAQADATHKEWETTIKEDKELGGEHLTETKELCARVVETFGNDELAEMLEATNLEAHPGWVRFAAKIGKMMSDDKFFPVKGAVTGGEKSMEQIFYGNSPESGEAAK